MQESMSLECDEAGESVSASRWGAFLRAARRLGQAHAGGGQVTSPGGGAESQQVTSPGGSVVGGGGGQASSGGGACVVGGGVVRGLVVVLASGREGPMGNAALAGEGCIGETRLVQPCDSLRV